MNTGNLKPKIITYGITRGMARDISDIIKYQMGAVDRSKQLIHSNDFIIGGHVALGLFATSMVALFETAIVPLELIGDGVNAVNRLRRKS